MKNKIQWIHIANIGPHQVIAADRSGKNACLVIGKVSISASKAAVVLANPDVCQSFVDAYAPPATPAAPVVTAPSKKKTQPLPPAPVNVNRPPTSGELQALVTNTVNQALQSFTQQFRSGNGKGRRFDPVPA